MSKKNTTLAVVLDAAADVVNVPTPAKKSRKPRAVAPVDDVAQRDAEWAAAAAADPVAVIDAGLGSDLTDALASMAADADAEVAAAATAKAQQESKQDASNDPTRRRATSGDGFKLLGAYGAAKRAGLDVVDAIEAELLAMPAGIRAAAVRRARGQDHGADVHAALADALARVPTSDGTSAGRSSSGGRRGATGLTTLQKSPVAGGTSVRFGFTVPTVMQEALSLKVGDAFRLELDEASKTIRLVLVRE